MHKTAAIHNLGCKVNSYEADAMRQMLMEEGYEIVDFSVQADVYVINTCSVTNVADKKSRQMIRRARKTNPSAIVVACGCYVQTADRKALSDLDIDLVIGNNQKAELIPQLNRISAMRQNAPGPTDGREEETPGQDALTGSVIDINQGVPAYEDLTISRQTGHTRAFIKVQDGCNQFCTYCIIPYARGRIRSRSLDNVRAEIEGLAEIGYREVVLNGIHLSSYGRDTGSSLLELIRMVHEIDGIERIRLGSLEPGLITEEFVRQLAHLSKVCPHFHLSLQSGSAAVLKRMNRHYTPEEYEEKCRILRAAYEHPAITTDIIVGFPGETQEEFSQTLAFAERIGFYEIHVFPYSRRDGTPAASMPGQITEAVKHARAKELLALTARQKKAFEEWYRGRECEVLFEVCREEDGVCWYEGFTPEYVRVRIPSDRDLRNHILCVPYPSHPDQSL